MSPSGPTGRILPSFISLGLAVCILSGCGAIIYRMVTDELPFSPWLGIGMAAGAAIGALLIIAAVGNRDDG